MCTGLAVGSMAVWFSMSVLHSPVNVIFVINYFNIVVIVLRMFAVRFNVLFAVVLKPKLPQYSGTPNQNPSCCSSSVTSYDGPVVHQHAGVKLMTY